MILFSVLYFAFKNWYVPCDKMYYWLLFPKIETELQKNVSLLQNDRLDFFLENLTRQRFIRKMSFAPRLIMKTYTVGKKAKFD